MTKQLSYSLVFFLDLLPIHSNMEVDKEYNLFDERVPKCVH